MLDERNKQKFLLHQRSAVGADEEEMLKLENYIYSSQLDKDVKRIIKKNYFFEPPRRYMLRKNGSNRRRKIYVFEEKNKFFLQFLNYLLQKKTDHRFSDSLYSFRKLYSLDSLFNKIKKFDPNREKYIVKLDIHSYGDTINTSVLDKLLRTWFLDEPEVHDFIMWLVTRNLYYTASGLERDFTSIMSGSPLTSYLENIYLMQSDEYMDKNAAIWARFADDIFAIVDPNNIDSSKKLLSDVRNIIEKDLKLPLNEEKTRIVPPGEPLDFLGLKFGNGYTDLASNSFRKVFNKFTHRANRINRQVHKGFYSSDIAMKKMADYIDKYFYGFSEEDPIKWVYRFFPYITRACSLNKLDKLSQECIRFVGTGRRTNAKYRIKYGDIKKLKYTPLVRSYFNRFKPGGMLYQTDKFKEKRNLF